MRAMVKERKKEEKDSCKCKSAQVWEGCKNASKTEMKSIQCSIATQLTSSLSQTRIGIHSMTVYQAVVLSLREKMIQDWNKTQELHEKPGVKQVFYLSIEYLLGRLLDNALINMRLKDQYAKALHELHVNVEDLLEEEEDAALGNGGLGRLAACFMDSLATLNYSARGYGLRYEYGMFKQQIADGYQVERPNFWLNAGNPWEVHRKDINYTVSFYGSVINDSGNVVWIEREKILAVAYDVLIPAYKSDAMLCVRLWSAKPLQENQFNFTHFNNGLYAASVEDRQNAEFITSVLYPNDNLDAGKELRLKQQYFFVSATLQDILVAFKKTQNELVSLAEMVSIQLNDTHPALTIVELQRILVDVEKIPWDTAWNIVTATCSFTNHTVLPEALEKWPVELFGKLLPRHLQIIYQINHLFLEKVKKRFPHNLEKIINLSIFEENEGKRIRMANLAIVGSHVVNGVSAVHTNLIEKSLFKDFVDFFGEQHFINITNGVSPRRWIVKANPLLASLFTKYIGSEDWVNRMDLLRNIDTDADFIKQWIEIKERNKKTLVEFIEKTLKIKVNANFMFDIQCKRIHEYKRQLMNILYIVYRYLQIKEMIKADSQITFCSRLVIFSGKAAPGYELAKLIIKLINSVAELINNDKDVENLLKVIFIPEYSVSIAELLIPASDISQHISTAGTEASGTSNMKFVMNGGLLVGTLDGANVEIMNQIGSENIFTFGCLTENVNKMRMEFRNENEKLCKVIEFIRSSALGENGIYESIFKSIQIENDFYLVHYDFESYVQTQERIDEEYADRDSWHNKCIQSALKMDYFSSDRTIKQYAEQIWKCQPVFPKNNYAAK